MKTEEEILDLFIRDSKKFYSLCRFCLTDSDGKCLSATLADTIMLCTAIQIEDDDGLPKTICDKCYENLETADNFRKMCHFTMSILARIQTNAKEISENSAAEIQQQTFIKEEHLSKEYDNTFDVEDCCDFKEDIPTKQEDVSGFSCNQSQRKTKKMELLLNENESFNNIISKTVQVTAQQKLYVCDICRKQLKRKKSLENHLRKVHNEGNMKKDVGRISGYGTERRYHCVECEYNTKYKIDLVIHIRRHTGEKPYKCEICMKCFTQQSTLNNHLKTHSDVMYYTCPHCGKQFKYKYKFERHKISHTQDKRYHCKICNRGLKSPKILEEHMNRHYNIKNYNCETCGSTFVTFSEMSIHSRIHGTEKKFQCHLCEYKTFVKASLEKHVRRHTGERPFVCDICQWKCYTQGELKVHSRTHTKEKNYSCPMCSTSFKTSSALNKHVIRTHGIKYRWSDHRDRRIIK